MKHTRLLYTCDIRDITEQLDLILGPYLNKDPLYHWSLDAVHQMWWYQTLYRLDKLVVQWTLEHRDTFDALVTTVISHTDRQHLRQLASAVWSRVVLPTSCYGDTIVGHFKRPTPHTLLLYFHL